MWSCHGQGEDAQLTLGSGLDPGAQMEALGQPHPRRELSLPHQPACTCTEWISWLSGLR